MSQAKLKEIEALKDLPHGWDGPGTGPPDRVSIRTAYELVRGAEGVAIRQCREWEDPVVAPRPDRGIDLLWERGERRLLLTIPMREEYQVQATLFRAGKKTLKRRLALVEACEEAAKVFEYWEPDEPKRRGLRARAERAAEREAAMERDCPDMLLTKEQVRWAREQYFRDTKNFPMILQTLAIPRPVLVELLLGKRRKQVGGPTWKGFWSPIPDRRFSRKINDEQWAWVLTNYRDKENGVGVREMARRLGCDRSVLHGYLREMQR